MAVGIAACADDALGGSCGDGELDVSGRAPETQMEQCDDGNTVAGDGCDEHCVVESGWSCEDAECQPVCGDGQLVADELCEPELTSDGQYCRDCRQLVPGKCGDSELLAPFEECDDGDDEPYDGCTDCRIDFGYQCQYDVVEVCVATGLSGRLRLESLEEEQVHTLCDWLVTQLGGPGTVHDCGTFDWRINSVDECVTQSLRDGFPETGHCTVAWLEHSVAAAGSPCALRQATAVCDRR